MIKKIGICFAVLTICFISIFKFLPKVKAQETGLQVYTVDFAPIRLKISNELYFVIEYSHANINYYSSNGATYLNGLYISYIIENEITSQKKYGLIEYGFGNLIPLNVNINDTFNYFALEIIFTEIDHQGQEEYDLWTMITLYNMDINNLVLYDIYVDQEEYDLFFNSSVQLDNLFYNYPLFLYSSNSYTYKSGMNENEVFTNGYNNGYSQGKNEGFQDGYFTGNNEGFNNGFNEGKSQGYSEGYNQGLLVADNDLTALFGGIADTPIMIIYSLLSFEVLGLSMFEILFGIVTVLVVIWLIKKFGS